uniref:Uncharacterized protein n=1 Tax=Panagrolaimus sp. JU765 TaxID=591449 RepID=A0AC34QYW8_9BILA
MLGGIGIGTFSQIKKKNLAALLIEQYNRLHDDQLAYPRCSTAAIELGIKIATPWKEYFTRDDKPFVTDSPLP